MAGALVNLAAATSEEVDRLHAALWRTPARLTAEQATVAQHAELDRGHWMVEALYHVRDTTFVKTPLN